MNNKEMKSEIMKIVAPYEEVGTHVNIRKNPPNVSVKCWGIRRNGKEVWIDLCSDGEDAEKFIREAEKASKKFHVSEEDALLWQLDSSGAISIPKKAVTI